MDENLKIIKEQENYIKEFPKLKFNDARLLYNKIKEEKHLPNAKILRNELINNTLYIVLKFIKNSSLIYFNSSMYDMNDIIHNCYEEFIGKIDNDILLEVNSYNEIFNYNFYTNVINKLGIDKFAINENTVLNVNNFSDVLLWFIKNNNDIQYEDLINYLVYKHNYTYYKVYNRGETVNCFDLLEGIYNSLDDNIELKKTVIEKLKYLLINSGTEMIRKNIENVIIQDYAEDIINKIYLKKIMDIIFNNSNLNESEIRILKKRYGIDTECCHTLEELAKEEGLTRERIRQKEAKALRKARRNMQLRKSL